MNLKDKRFLVAGLGRSGIAAAKLLKRMRISFSLFDGSPDFDRESFYEKNKELKGAEIFLGSLKEEQMLKTDILVLSPGIPADLPMVNDMRALGVWIWGEIELAYVFSKGRTLAVTGTNGKTTTTALLGEILKNYLWMRTSGWL